MMRTNLSWTASGVLGIVRFLGVVALGVVPHSVVAQTTAPPPPPEREGSAEFAFVGTTGNSSTQTIGVGGELIYRPSPWESKVKVNYVRSEADDQLRAQALVLALRVQRKIRARLSGFGEYGYQRDRFAGMLNRNVVQGGLAYSLLEQAPHKLTSTRDSVTRTKNGSSARTFRQRRSVEEAFTRSRSRIPAS